MTNLEYYKQEIYEIQRDLFENKDICVAYGVGAAICKVYTKYTGLNAFMPMVLDWLLAEHKEPIKLTKFEYDLLMSYINKGYSFKNYSELKEMRNKGYFEGVTDTSMTINEILDNCEVINK